MNTKLTLTIDSTVIERAKKYAKSKGRSLSDLIENYLKALIQKDGSKEIPATPIVKSLRGSFKPPAEPDYKKAIAKSLADKYDK
jgi:predicted CopG family antitoxin